MAHFVLWIRVRGYIMMSYLSDILLLARSVSAVATMTLSAMILSVLPMEFMAWRSARDRVTAPQTVFPAFSEELDSERHAA
jgi:hypothetical protein